MTKREKTLGAAVAMIIGGLAAYQWAAAPALAWYASVQADAAACGDQFNDAQMLVDHRRQIVADWRARHAAGLLDDEKAARFRAQQILSSAARTSGFTIDSLGSGQHVPAAEGQSYDLLGLNLTGQGALAQTQGFLAAIEQAALPLRIERCEMSAREGGKDQIDLSLTLSMRIASEAARKTITVPAKTPAWQPPTRSEKLDQEVLAARPFLADRPSFQPPRTPSGAAIATPPPSGTTTLAGTPKAVPGAGWMLVGLVIRDGIGEALLVHAADGREQTVHAGDKVEDGLVKTVDADGLHMAYGAQERLIEPGFDLAGGQVASTTASAGLGNPPPASFAAPPSTIPSAPIIIPDADREAILNRLRQRRNHTSP